MCSLKMEQIKFCNGPFQMYPLMKLLKGNEASYKTLCEGWEQFGYNLGLEQNEIECLKGNLESGRSQLANILRDIFRIWRDAHGEDANLNVLYDALVEIKLEELAGSIQEKFGGKPEPRCDIVAPPPPSKRLKRMDPEIEIESKSTKSGDGDGNTALLRAVRRGHNLNQIKKLLDDGAPVNAVDNDNNNAVHEVIGSLIYKRMTPGVGNGDALAILSVLVSYGFNLINGSNTNTGLTPLLYAMQIEDLNEDLLTWFSENGADFNAVEEKSGDSVVFHAIIHRQGGGIIRKILEFGGNPRHVNKWKENALHMSALYAHESAMEIFIDKVDVNERNKYNCTPLHLLFSKEDLDYQHCLKMLVRKGADFGAERGRGYVPIVNWMKQGKANPFPTLIKIKDRLNITPEIASATLTAVVWEMKWQLQYLPSSSSRGSEEQEPNSFVKFVMFLIEEKEAKLRLKDEVQWKLENWEKLEDVLLNQKFLNELRARTSGSINWSEKLIEIKAQTLGKLDFQANSSCVNVPIENILACLLACKKYNIFQQLSVFLKKFCADPIISKK